MTMGMKFASFVFIFTVMLLEPKLNVHGQSISIQKLILNYIFPKDPDVVRVRKPEDIRTTTNNVTTLDFCKCEFVFSIFHPIKNILRKIIAQLED